MYNYLNDKRMNKNTKIALLRAELAMRDELIVAHKKIVEARQKQLDQTADIMGGVLRKLEEGEEELAMSVLREAYANMSKKGTTH